MLKVDRIMIDNENKFGIKNPKKYLGFLYNKVSEVKSEYNVELANLIRTMMLSLFSPDGYKGVYKHTVNRYGQSTKLIVLSEPKEILKKAKVYRWDDRQVRISIFTRIPLIIVEIVGVTPNRCKSFCIYRGKVACMDYYFREHFLKVIRDFVYCLKKDAYAYMNRTEEDSEIRSIVEKESKTRGYIIPDVLFNALSKDQEGV